jgi:hypothetical protein
MSKLKNLEITKLLKELDFIQSNFDYKNEIVNEADSMFIESINNFLTSHPELKEVYDNKITEKINNSIKNEREVSIEDDEKLEHPEEEGCEEEKTEDDIKNKENISAIKKLYREIVKLTHPDKVNNKKMNELYLKSTEYYKEDNKIGIYAVCNELDISYEISNDDINLIYDQIKKYEQKISFIESTYTWKWYNCNDLVEKDQIMVNYIKMRIK